MSDLIDTLRDHSKQASEEFGHPVEELLFWEAADHIELNAVNYLVLDNEYQTALVRIDSLEAVLKRLGDPEEVSQIVINVFLLALNFLSMKLICANNTPTRN